MDAMHDYCRAEGIKRVVLTPGVRQPLYYAMGYVFAEEPMMRLRCALNLGDQFAQIQPKPEVTVF